MQSFCAPLCNTQYLRAGAVVYDIRNCFDIREKGDEMAKLLHEVASEIMGHRPAHEFGGWCMDHTKASVIAIPKLETIEPKWVHVGCFSHSLNLAIKDLCKFQPSSIIEGASTSVEGGSDMCWGLEWLQTCYESANTVANFFRYCYDARMLLEKHQEAACGTVKPRLMDQSPRRMPHHTALCVKQESRRRAVSDPTRSSSNVSVMQDLTSNKVALVECASSSAYNNLFCKPEEYDDWSDSESECDMQCTQWNTVEHKDAVYGILTDACGFWEHQAVAIELLKPFCDVMHEVESDSSDLSQ